MTKRTQFVVSQSLITNSERIKIFFQTLARMDEMGSQYRCDFAGGDCDWTTSGKMRWNLTQVEYKSIKFCRAELKLDLRWGLHQRNRLRLKEEKIIVILQEYGSNGVTNYMDMNMADYFNKDLVTVGMLRYVPVKMKVILLFGRRIYKGLI